jgi:hypothetical protein
MEALKNIVKSTGKNIRPKKNVHLHSPAHLLADTRAQRELLLSHISFKAKATDGIFQLCWWHGMFEGGVGGGRIVLIQRSGSSCAVPRVHA